MTAIDKLLKKINLEYESMREIWWDMTADELIENAEQIAAVKFIRTNIESCILDDAADYLLSFKNPLEVLMGTLASRYDPMDIAARETFSEMLREIYDKHDLDS
ncbi:hypothetical protein SAMN02910447_03142, partial [Ruminococcus sp. YE71]